MSSNSEPGPLPAPNNVPEGSNELDALLEVISAGGSLPSEAIQSPEEREKYLRDLRAAIERAKEIGAGAARNPPSPGPSTPFSPFPKVGKGPPDLVTVKQSILHIDDDKGTLALVRQILTDAGYKVVSAESGFEGVDHFRRRPYDFSLALVDLTMPLMDGEETFARLREIRPDVAVILATGFIQEERLANLKSVGLAGFLRKPLPPDEIVSMVRSTLDNVKYARGTFSTGSTPITL